MVLPDRQAIYPGLTYVDSSSFLHRLHPLVKLVLLFSFSFTVFALSSLVGEVLLFCLLVAALPLAGLGPAFFFRKLRFILFFGFFIFLVQLLAVREGLLLWQLALGPLTLSLWSAGFLGGLAMMLRFLNIIGASFLFVATTDPNRLAYALMEAGLPYRFGFMLITALRFIPLFQLELTQVRNAQLAKGIDLEGLSPRKLLTAVKYLYLPLVISALSKVETLAISMENRAFGLYPSRTYLASQALTGREKGACLAIPLLFLLLYLALEGGSSLAGIPYL
ncbi:MAG: energy-coupling factor transporter transmembrane component T [bacterium]|jgi:energy-coupling factor transport system permease protein|nr:energy-coupling factor transporter transmembrane component T [Bacillota bacterium]HHW54654.1 energy-coupling factor transporter transmembrane protein EcfT [Bacillota bacterium]